MTEYFARYAVSRGLVPAHPAPVATELTGGVSGVVVLVQGADTSVVVKQALAQLRVPGTWLATPERALTEAAALKVVHRLTPQHTPRVLDVDPFGPTFAMTAAPAGWRSWKDVLLDGYCTDAEIEAVARTLGQILGTWHRDTWHDPELAARFDDYEALEQLRITPFHRAVADRHPDLAPVVLGCAQELTTRRDCLVHGDYSPKNVLVGDGLWVLDLEVAHVGAAVFDLAFVQCHLMLKAIHLPHRAAALATAGRALLADYRALLGERTPGPELAAHTACLLLARVDGVSPAGYLRETGAAVVTRVSTQALRHPGLTLDDLWDRVTADATLDLTADHANHPNHDGKARS